MLTVKQAAEKLGISPALVYALCARRRLRHERHGLGRGKIVIPEGAIEEYRRSVTLEAAEAAPVLPPVTEEATAGRFGVLDAGRLRDAWKQRR